MVNFLKKGSLLYICVTNNKHIAPNSLVSKDPMDAMFLDDLAYYKKHTTGRTNMPDYRPRGLLETAGFVQMQLQFLHLQFVSLVTSQVLKQLNERPNLDIKSSIVGLERTLHMMCEVSGKSPTCLLEAYQPLRLPESERKVFDTSCSAKKRPEKLAFGMTVTALNVINVFTDVYDEIKAHDVAIIFNYIWANPSMKNGETWTPICVPGCSEDFMLHVYICFKQPNLGLVLVCTDHLCFEECHEFA